MMRNIDSLNSCSIYRVLFLSVMCDFHNSFPEKKRLYLSVCIQSVNSHSCFAVLFHLFIQMEDSVESKWTLKSDASSEPFLYCSSACDCSEEPFCEKVSRNRTEARSMSMPSAPSSAKFR